MSVGMWCPSLCELTSGHVTPPAPQEQPPGLVVYEVFATDGDEGVNGEVRYAFLQMGAGNRDWENFHIDALTGVITTAVRLDREKQALYSVSAWHMT